MRMMKYAVIHRENKNFFGMKREALLFYREVEQRHFLSDFCAPRFVKVFAAGLQPLPPEPYPGESECRVPERPKRPIRR